MGNGLFSRTTWKSRYQKGKASLDLNEARDRGGLRCSGISWTIRKQSARRSRQIATPTPHHSIFYRPDALPDAQPTTEGSLKTGTSDKIYALLDRQNTDSHRFRNYGSADISGLKLDNGSNHRHRIDNYLHTG